MNEKVDIIFAKECSINEKLTNMASMNRYLSTHPSSHTSSQDNVFETDMLCVRDGE